MPSESIMIVEDREPLAMVIKDMLSMNGFNVVGIAFSGSDAMEIFMNERPKMILMDILLPDISGFEVTRKILEIDKDVKIIAITAMADEDVSDRSKEAGCIAYLVKPFRMKQLIDMVRSV